MSPMQTISPREAREHLHEGNSRYCKEGLIHYTDSRTPPEHAFDAGLGEIFVCRNAGDLVVEVTLGSCDPWRY